MSAALPGGLHRMRAAPEHAINDPELNRRRYSAHTARLETQIADRQRQLDLKKASVARRSSSP
jgi:hypothetical protein